LTWNLDYNQIAIPEHRLVRWLFGVAEERPPPEPAIESLQSASSRVKFVCASSGPSVEWFRFFRLFRGCKFDRASTGRAGKLTTAKDTKYAKTEATGRIPLKQGPSCNPTTVRNSMASTAINEDAGKRKPRVDLRAHQSFAPAKTSPSESFFIQRTSRITRSERLSNHCPRDTQGLGVHPFIRWCIEAARERPPPERAIESLQSASSRAKFVCASSAASAESFRFFRLFRGLKFDRASIGRTGEMTTAKDTKYAKTEATGRILLKQGPSWNPITVCNSMASTAINEDAGKRKPPVDLRSHQSFVSAKTSPLESFFIQRTYLSAVGPV
jgi:hypothetical protein